MVNKKNKYYFFILLIIFPGALIASERDIHYRILFPINNQCINVEAEFETNDNAQLIVQIPDIGTLSGKIEPKDVRIELIENQPSYRKIISKKPHQKVKLSHNFCYQNDFNNLEFPSLRENEFYFTPAMVLPIPGYTQFDCLPWNITIHFDNYNSKYLYTSLGDHSNEIKTSMILEDFLNIYMMWTQSQVHILEKSPLIQMIIFGDKPELKHELRNNLLKIIKTQRYLMNSTQAQPLKILLNFKNKDSHQVGKHPLNALVMNAWPDTKLFHLLYAISHEHAHEWLGLKIKFPWPQGEFQWLLEGLTDYIGVISAFESGVLNKASYLYEVNRAIKIYALNPFKELSNQELFQKYYEDPAYGQQALYRGHLAALELQDSDSGTSLYDNLPISFVRQLYVDFKESNQFLVDWELINTAFAKSIGASQWSAFYKKINGEIPINLPKSLLEGEAILIDQEVEIPDLGFDLKNLIVSRKVGKVDPDSQAYLAGLRENQDVINTSIKLSDSDYTSVVTIFEEGQIKPIQFVPKKMRHIKVPQYMLNNQKSTSDKANPIDL